MTASEVVDAAGFGGADVCDCDDADVAVEAAAESVPLVLAGGWGGERLVVEEVFCEAMDWALDLRVEPTNFRKRLFMDDIET